MVFTEATVSFASTLQHLHLPSQRFSRALFVFPILRRQPVAFSLQPSAFRHQLSAFSLQSSAICLQPSALRLQPSAFAGRKSFEKSETLIELKTPIYIPKMLGNWPWGSQLAMGGYPAIFWLFVTIPWLFIPIHDCSFLLIFHHFQLLLITIRCSDFPVASSMYLHRPAQPAWPEVGVEVIPFFPVRRKISIFSSWN